MAIFKRKIDIESEVATGFGVSSENSSGRFYDRETGGANVIKRGVGIFYRYSWYHTMLAMSRARFLSILFVS